MTMFTRGCGLLLAMFAGACGGGTSITPPTPTPPSTISFRGQVTDGATGSGISGAVVMVLGCGFPESTTDDLGNYTLMSSVSGPFCGVADASKAGYEDDDRQVGALHTLNFHLYRVERLTAGESTVLTVRPDDTICPIDVVDVQGGFGPGPACRTVRITASSDGILTVKAVPVQANAAPPELELQALNRNWCCQNLQSISVARGTEVMANVGMRGRSDSQSFVLTTSIASR